MSAAGRDLLSVICPEIASPEDSHRHRRLRHPCYIVMPCHPPPSHLRARRCAWARVGTTAHIPCATVTTSRLAAHHASCARFRPYIHPRGITADVIAAMFHPTARRPRSMTYPSSASSLHVVHSLRGKAAVYRSR